MHPRSGRPRFGASRKSLSVALLGTLLLSVSSAHLTPVGERVPLSQAAVDRILADLNAVPPRTTLADYFFEVEGPLLDVRVADTIDPAFAGIMNVSGMWFAVPTGLLIDVGVAPAGTITLAQVLEAPSYVNNATVIATGTTILLLEGGAAADDGAAIVFVAASIFLERSENVVAGIVTENDPARGVLRINDVPVRMDPDPRLPKSIVDITGQPLAIEDLEPGRLVGMEGAWNRSGQVFDALFIELDGIVEPAEGEIDFISVKRAQVRVARPEMRIVGWANDPDADLTVYAYDPGNALDPIGEAMIGPFRAAPITGEFDVRAPILPGFVATMETPTDYPAQVAVVSSRGGMVLAPLSQG